MYIKSGKKFSQIKTYVFIFRANKGSVLSLARQWTWDSPDYIYTHTGVGVLIFCRFISLHPKATPTALHLSSTQLLLCRDSSYSGYQPALPRAAQIINVTMPLPQLKLFTCWLLTSRSASAPLSYLSLRFLYSSTKLAYCSTSLQRLLP